MKPSMNRARGEGAVCAYAPATLLCLGITAHLLFLLSLRFGWLNPLFNDTGHRFGPGGDFFSIHAAREWPARARTLPERERGSKEGMAAKRAYI